MPQLHKRLVQIQYDQLQAAMNHPRVSFFFACCSFVLSSLFGVWGFERSRVRVEGMLG